VCVYCCDDVEKDCLAGAPRKYSPLVFSPQHGTHHSLSLLNQVLEQFLNTTVEDKDKLTEAYLVGNRLVKFVSRVLPTHSDYFSNDPKLVELRGQSQAQLVQLLQYLEELALIIDEEEYQDFVRENQELLAFSEEESLTEEEDEVSSFGEEEEEPSMSFGEGPSFVASDVAQSGVNESQNLEDFEAPTQSRIRAIQNQESESWDQAFSNQIAPQLPEFELHRNQPEQKQQESATFEVEWAFPTDFDTEPYHAEVERMDTSASSSLPVDFCNAWPSEHDTSVSSNVWINRDQRQGPDSSFSASPEQPCKAPEKMTLRPKALYGSPSSSEREQSPKSVYELPEFMPEQALKNNNDDESSSPPPTVFSSGSVEGYLQRVDAERPPPCDDGMSALTGEEEELSLTGAPMRRRKRMGHFKGCVRCLLE